MLETGRFLTERRVVHTGFPCPLCHRLYFERNKSSFKPAYRKIRSSLYSFFFKHINLLFHIVFIFSISLMLPGK